MNASVVTPLGEFRDPEEERHFRESQLPVVATQSRRNALIAGTAYLSGAVPFGWAFGLTPEYHATNVGRVLVFIACLVLAFHPAMARDRRALERASVAVASIAALALLPMSILTPLGAHGNGTLAVAVMVVVALFLDVPIRWATRVVVLIALQTLIVNSWVLHATPADAGLVAIVVVPIGLMSVLAAARLGATQRWLVASRAAEHGAQRELRREADERTRAETAARQRERALIELVEHTPLPLVIAERGSAKLVVGNRAWRRLMAVAEDAVDVSLADFVPPPVRRQLSNALDADQHFAGTDVIITRADGVAVEAQVSAVATTIDGRSCVVLSVLDLTAERERTRALELARAAADQTSRAKSDFLAHMSHEIRTPLNGVLGLAELLLDTELTFDQRDMVRTLRSSGDLLLEVINGILDLSKVESAAFELEQRVFDPVEVLDRSFEPLALKGRDKGLACRLGFAPGLPHFLSGDEVRVRQVFNNLVGNAIKFTERGEVEVHVSAAPQGSGWRLSFAVRDTGIGVEASALGRLFEPFRQADASITRKFGGTGLGLHITRQITQRMGGDVTASSVPGQGTTFVAHMMLDDANLELPERPSAWLCELPGRPSCPTSLRPILSSLGFDPAVDPSLASVVVVDAAAGGDVAPTRAPGVWLRRAGDPAGPTTWVELMAPWNRRTLGAALDQARLVQPPPKPVEARPRSSQLRVLIAEDNVVNQKVLARLLARLNVQCDVVGDGAAALDALRARAYDLVFMDVQMPLMDGLQASRSWRSEEAGTTRLPIVAVTAHAMKEHRQQALGAGMDDVLTKPVSRAAVEAAIARWTRDARSERLHTPERDALAEPRALG